MADRNLDDRCRPPTRSSGPGCEAPQVAIDILQEEILGVPLWKRTRIRIATGGRDLLDDRDGIAIAAVAAQSNTHRQEPGRLASGDQRRELRIPRESRALRTLLRVLRWLGAAAAAALAVTTVGQL